MKPLKLRSLPSRLPLFGFVLGILVLPLIGSPCAAQSRFGPVRIAYSAVSAGIGTLWLTHEDGYFRKYGLDSHLVYIRGGTTAVQALLADEIHFGHWSPAPMMTAWAQGADFVWLGTTTHQMVFTLITDPSITKASDLKGKRIGITRIGSASDLALRNSLKHFGLNSKDVATISLGGIPDILAAMKAGAVNGGILSPPTSTAARDMGYRTLLHIPDLGKEFTFSGIAARRSLVEPARARSRLHGRAHRWRQSLQRRPSSSAQNTSEIYARGRPPARRRLQGI